MYSSISRLSLLSSHVCATAAAPENRAPKGNFKDCKFLLCLNNKAGIILEWISILEKRRNMQSLRSKSTTKKTV